VVDEVEILKNDLDAVSKDLDRLSKGNNVELHATFDKFGKTANLQLHDAPLSEEEGEEDPPGSTGLKFWKTPTVRQVFDRFCAHVDFSTSIRAFYTEVLTWRKHGRWNCLLTYFMLASSPLMPQL